MTVKELKEKLDQFPENYIVLINADEETRRLHDGFPYTEATCVVRGINELDGCVLIDDYVEDEDDCSGCVYEDADGSTTAISNCVCCSRNVEFAKNDYYVKK